METTENFEELHIQCLIEKIIYFEHVTTYFSWYKTGVVSLKCVLSTGGIWCLPKFTFPERYTYYAPTLSTSSSYFFGSSFFFTTITNFNNLNLNKINFTATYTFESSGELKG